MSYVCPRCRKDTSLWREVLVPGWQSCDGDLKPALIGSPTREVEWSNAEPTHDYGCSGCGWEGNRAELEQLGIDGEPLPHPIPGQERLI